MSDPVIVGRQVALLYRNILLSQCVSIANASLLAWLWHHTVGAVAAAAWWCTAVAVAAARLSLQRAYAGSDERRRVEQAGIWLRRARLGALGGGLVWGAGTLLFALGADTVQQSFTAFIMAGMVAGAILVLGADDLAFRLYSWPIIIATAIATLGTDLLHLAFTLMAVLLLFISTRSARHLHQTLQESLQLERDKDALLTRLSAAKDAAEQSNRAKTEFLANISHELRTPMNGIVGMSELIGMEKLSPSQQEFLAHLHEAADEMLTLIQNLIELSALESGQAALQAHPFDLLDFLPPTLASASRAAAAKALDFELQSDESLPPVVVGDADRLRRILSHLADNAVKFTERGRVGIAVKRVKATHETVHVEFTVADTGMGIAPDKLQAIFEPFTQADGSVTRRHPGAGIGLPICRKLTELMGGSLTVQSQPGVGSSFRLCLPFALPAADGALTGPCPDSSGRADRLPA